jgi:hypothetical protein
MITLFIGLGLLLPLNAQQEKKVKTTLQHPGVEGPQLM